MIGMESSQEKAVPEEVMKTIQAIDASTVHKICSGQVVLSLAVAVKELVENALDAGANSVEVRLKNYGIDLIEVSDNGSGVVEENFAALTLKYHTSKLSDYSDLMGVSSFGFRGEALSSLCALSDLVITTRHKSAPCAMKIEYDHKGNIKKSSPCSRQVGTTVSLTNLFHSLPVRQKEFHKNAKREFTRMTQLLYAYCLISVGVSIAEEKNDHQEMKRKSTTILDFISVKSMKLSSPNKSNYDETGVSEVCKLETYEATEDTPKNLECINEHIPEDNVDIAINNTTNDLKKDLDYQKDHNGIMFLEFTDNIPNTQIREVHDVVDEHRIRCKTISLKTSKSVMCDSPKASNISKKVLTDKEDLGKFNRKTVTMKTSLEHVIALAEIYNKKIKKTRPDRVKFKSEINPVFNKKCEEELQREISHNSFKQMEIVGQFNLGFIITRLDEDLFIVDQHATDEIYNFETLQKSTVLTSQKLVLPQQLDLTGVNEQILMDNLQVFTKNGFSFEINEDALPTKRVKLTTIPMSKNWIFGKEDIEELLFMLREAPSEYCRPSRVRAMFASRACRKSVMIGTALARSDMKKLVDHMAEIDKPWNCPHGRPTIRHLVNLAMVHGDYKDSW